MGLQTDMPTQTSRPGESLCRGVRWRVDVRWDSFLAWDERRSDQDSAGCALISLCVVDWLARAMLVSCISFKIDESMILDFRKEQFATLKQACRGNQFWVSFSASFFVCARLCVCGLTHLIVCSDACVYRQTLACMCVSLCTCFCVLLNSKGYSYHKKKGDLMSKHLPCLAFPLNVSLLCSIFTVTSCRKCGEAKCSLPTKCGHLKSTVSPLCFRFVLLGCRRIGGKPWFPIISVFHYQLI